MIRLSGPTFASRLNHVGADGRLSGILFSVKHHLVCMGRHRLRVGGVALVNERPVKHG